MGKTTNQEINDSIKKSARSIKGVTNLKDLLAHYVGPYVHAEVHIAIDKRINLHRSHTIGKKVQHKIESIDSIDRAFIHIDPT